MRQGSMKFRQLVEVALSKLNRPFDLLLVNWTRRNYILYKAPVSMNFSLNSFRIPAVIALGVWFCPQGNVIDSLNLGSSCGLTGCVCV